MPINQMVGDSPQGSREFTVRPSADDDDLVQVVAQARGTTNLEH